MNGSIGTVVSDNISFNARRVVLITALREEISPLLRAIKLRKRIKARGKKFYLARLGQRDLLLVRSAMGEKNTLEALQFVQDSFRPDFVINFGYCGALSLDLQIGDVFCVTEYIKWPFALREPPAIPLQQPFNDSYFRQVIKASVFSGTCLTCPAPLPKRKLARLYFLEGKKTVVDMEGYFCAEFCQNRGIPCASLKSVTDTLHEEFHFELAALCSGSKDIDPLRAILLASKYPWLIPHFWHLWRYSTKAAKNLRDGILFLLSLPVLQSECQESIFGRTN